MVLVVFKIALFAYHSICSTIITMAYQSSWLTMLITNGKTHIKIIAKNKFMITLKLWNS